MQGDGESAAMADMARHTGRTRTVSIVLALAITVLLSLLCASVAWGVQAALMDRVYAALVGVAFGAPFAVASRIATMLGDWWLLTRREDWIRSASERHGLSQDDVREILEALE